MDRSASSHAQEPESVKRVAELALSQAGRSDFQIAKVEMVARGGYNEVWKVSSVDPNSEPFIVRIPISSDLLMPSRVENEVGWTTYLSLHHPDIPVARAFAHSTDPSHPFVAQPFVAGQTLDKVWHAYTEEEKTVVAGKLAELVVKMGEVRFPLIGSMTPSHRIGPTVEGHKHFKGRDKFHSTEWYDIGPYPTKTAYVLASYDKEISYHLHAPASDIDGDLFETVSPVEYTQRLRSERASIASDPTACGDPDEPFVLVHGDFSGSNVIVQGTDVKAVIDWDFAGSFPLSELASDGFEVFETTSDEDVEEMFKWDKKIFAMMEAVAVRKGWEGKDLGWLLGGGNPTFQTARVEMFP